MIDIALPPKLRTPIIRHVVEAAEAYYAAVKAYEKATATGNETEKTQRAVAIVQNAHLFAQSYRAYLDTSIYDASDEQLRAADQGDQQAIQQLYDDFLARATSVEDDSPIQNTVIIDLLRDQRTGKVGARQELRAYLEKQLDHLCGAILYPEQQNRETHAETMRKELQTLHEHLVAITVADGQAAIAKDMTVATTGTLVSAKSPEIEESDLDRVAARDQWGVVTDDQWGDFISNTGGAAERLWRDFFLGISPDNVRARLSDLEITAECSHHIWLLWLEASLHRLRSSANGVGHHMGGGGFGRENSTRQSIREKVNFYTTQLRQWDKELRKQTGRSFFLEGFLDSEQLRRLIKKFGEASSEEDGWLSQAEDAQAELRYQLRDEIVRELWRNHRRVSSAALWLLKITTGYGTRPRNFVITAASVVGVDAFLFFLFDLLNPGIPAATHGVYFCVAARPHVASWVDVVTLIVRYLYIAVTNITSLGSDASLATYCGGMGTQILLIATTITGYILLGLLVSLFFRLLVEAS